jgi:hypothetical protein
MKLILQAVKSLLRCIERLIDSTAAGLRAEITLLDNKKIDAQDPVTYGSFRLNPKDGATIGEYSTAEGRNCTSSGVCTHAEGYNCTASSYASHAEGVDCFATGSYSHAEGDTCLASAFGSHAEGTNTVARGPHQHVQGKYNIESQTKAHIVGNGTSDANRSNAHTLDWDGNAWFAGNIYLGGTGMDDPNAKTLVQVVIDALPIYNGEVEDV